MIALSFSLVRTPSPRQEAGPKHTAWHEQAWSSTCLLAPQGGFSYADVLDSAKGWAGTIRRNAQLWQQFCAFYARCAAVLLGYPDATSSACTL